MRGAAAPGTSGRGQAEMRTVAVVIGALIGTVLAGGVEHQDVQHQLQLALMTQEFSLSALKLPKTNEIQKELAPNLKHNCAVESAAFVCTLNTAQVKICPVNEIPVLGQTKGVRKVVYNDLPLKAYRR